MNQKPPQHPKKIHNITLPSLFDKIKLLQELNTSLSKYLEQGLQQACQVANLIENRLILIASSGSTATQIRYLVPDLLRQFKSDAILKNIREIECKVRPPQLRKRLTPAHQPVTLLSQESASIIQRIADTIDDPKLKEVLKRIATRT